MEKTNFLSGDIQDYLTHLKNHHEKVQQALDMIAYTTAKSDEEYRSIKRELVCLFGLS